MMLPRRIVRVESSTPCLKQSNAKIKIQNMSEIGNMDSSKDCRAKFVNFRSKQIVDSELIEHMSEYVMELLSLSISEYTQKSENKLKCGKVFLSETGKNSQKEIIELYKFIRNISKFTVCELICSFVLLKKFVHWDFRERLAFRSGVFSRDNVGTVILCSVIIAIKYIRDWDNACWNNFWSKYFNIQLNVINASESEFLRAINYDCFIDEKIYECIFSRLCNPFEGVKASTTRPVHLSLCGFVDISF